MAGVYDASDRGNGVQMVLQAMTFENINGQVSNTAATIITVTSALHVAHT
jgi:hypothetical protein